PDSGRPPALSQWTRTGPWRERHFRRASMGVPARGRPRRQRPPDLPVMAERILDAAEEPAVLPFHRIPPPRAGLDRQLDRRLRVVDDEEHPHRRAAERLRAEGGARGRFVGDPERRAADRELGYAVGGTVRAPA